jgi:hypothetical protein
MIDRMRQLIDIAEHRKLTDEEKAELQKLFIGVAENDLVVEAAVTMQEWQTQCRRKYETLFWN